MEGPLSTPPLSFYSGFFVPPKKEPSRISEGKLTKISNNAFFISVNFLQNKNFCLFLYV